MDLERCKSVLRMRRNGWGQSGEEELDEEGAETADEQGEANHANHDGTPSLQAPDEFAVFLSCLPPQGASAQLVGTNNQQPSKCVIL